MIHHEHDVEFLKMGVLLWRARLVLALMNTLLCWRGQTPKRFGDTDPADEASIFSPYHAGATRISYLEAG